MVDQRLTRNESPWKTVLTITAPRSSTKSFENYLAPRHSTRELTLTQDEGRGTHEAWLCLLRARHEFIVASKRDSNSSAFSHNSSCTKWTQVHVVHHRSRSKGRKYLKGKRSFYVLSSSEDRSSDMIQQKTYKRTGRQRGKVGKRNDCTVF